jgi:hypothetical protein
MRVLPVPRQFFEERGPDLYCGGTAGINGPTENCRAMPPLLEDEPTDCHRIENDCSRPEAALMALGAGGVGAQRIGSSHALVCGDLTDGICKCLRSHPTG